MIVEQYGYRITDRVTIKRVGPHSYQAHFDDQWIGTFLSGANAVRGAKQWLKRRDEEHKERQRAEAKEEARRQEIADDAFLYRVFPNIEHGDLDTLIEVFKRKLKNR